LLGEPDGLPRNNFNPKFILDEKESGPNKEFFDMEIKNSNDLGHLVTASWQPPNTSIDKDLRFNRKDRRLAPSKN